METILDFLGKLFPASCHARIYLVGGSVRDHLLGRDSKDLDLVAALSADELTSCGFHLVEGRSTAPIWFRYDQTFGKIEVTAVADSADLNQDLVRRDFTINALAMGLAGEITDPLNSRHDLEQRTLRACSHDTFLDDPLRIFRALRFEADGWRMEPDTQGLIRGQDWTQRLGHIPVERFSREMLKALEAAEPERFFQGILEFGVGENILPEIFRMPTIPAGPLSYHPEGDLLTHSIQVLQRVSQRTCAPLARFCALFHDIGKLATDPALYPKHHGHDEAGSVMARTFCDRLRLPTAYRTALAWSSRLHGKLNRWNELRDATRIKTAEQAIKAGITEILALISMADKEGGLEIKGWESTIHVSSMTTADLGIDRGQLEGMPASKRSDFILQKRVEMLRRFY